MATFNLRRFANPDALTEIHEKHLRSLLQPHRGFLHERGVTFESNVPLDMRALARLLLAPDDAIPETLVTALYLVHEMSSPAQMNLLLRVAPDGLVDLSHGSRPADVALQVWLRAPQILERVHACRFVGARKTFEYHMAPSGPRELAPPSKDVVESFEKVLGQWFADKEKGAQVRVFVYSKSDGLWFVIRHGGAFRRERALKADKTATLLFRPARHDIVIYNQKAGELRVNAGTKGEKAMYRRVFGAHFFGDENHFPNRRAKYTLEPLAKDPERALVCSDVAGMDSVNLKEVRYFWGGDEGEIEIRRAKNLARALKRRRHAKVPVVRMLSATFEVQLTGARNSRSVCIELPNVARYVRAGAGNVIDEWLTKRGFIRTREAV